MFTFHFHHIQSALSRVGSISPIEEPIHIQIGRDFDKNSGKEFYENVDEEFGTHLPTPSSSTSSFFSPPPLAPRWFATRFVSQTTRHSRIRNAVSVASSRTPVAWARHLSLFTWWYGSGLKELHGRSRPSFITFQKPFIQNAMVLQRWLTTSRVQQCIVNEHPFTRCVFSQTNTGSSTQQPRPRNRIDRVW